MVSQGPQESSFRQEEAQTNLGGMEGAGCSLSLRASSTFFSKHWRGLNDFHWAEPGYHQGRDLDEMKR